MAVDPYAVISGPPQPPSATGGPPDPYAVISGPAQRPPGPATMAEQLAAKQAEALKKRQQAALREWHEDKPTYFKKLLFNAPDDIKRQLLGIVGLGADVVGATAELGSDLGNFVRDVIPGLDPYYLKDKPSQARLKQTLESLPDELIAHYAGYLDPEGLALKIQEGPVTTALDVIPAAAAVGKVGKVGAATARAAGRLVTSPGIAGRVAKSAITHVPVAGPFLRNAIDLVEGLQAANGPGPAGPAIPRPPRPTPMPGITTRQPRVAPVDDFGVAPHVPDPAAAPGWTPDEIALSTVKPEYVTKALAEAEAAAGLTLTPEQQTVAATLMVKYGASPEMAVQAALGEAAPATMPATPRPGTPAPPPAVSELVGARPPATATGGAAAAVPEAQVAPDDGPGGPPGPTVSALVEPGPVTSATALVDTLDTPWAGRTRGQQSPAWLESDLGLAARRAGVTLAVAQRAAARELVRTGGLTPVEAVQKVAAAPAASKDDTPRSIIRAATTTERIQDKVRDLYAAVGGSQLGKLADALGVSDFEGIERSFSDPEPQVAMGMPGPPGLRKAGTVLTHMQKIGRARARLSGAELQAFDRAYLAKNAPLNGRPLGSLARTLVPGRSEGIYTLRDEAVDRLRDIYSIGTEMTSSSNWAGAASDDLVRAFGGDRDMALKWARMWGATSPNTSVPVNTRESISALVHALEHPGKPMTIELAQTLPQGKITMAPSKVPNLNNALEGRPLSGDKVEAMAAFMAGHPRIPIDVHALYAIGSDADKLGPELKALRKFMAKAEDVPVRGSFTKTDLYVRYEDALRRALQSFDPDRNINQIFAELWEGARFHKGLKHQGGPIDILRRKGLLEYGAMLDPDRLRGALESQGWTAKGIAGFFAAMGLGAGAMAEGEGGAGATGVKP